MSSFSPQVFAWFEGLERDNTKAYFTATRDFYEEEVRGGLEALLDDLRDELGGDVKVFRQQRDLRFTPDKTPYKTRTYGHRRPALRGDRQRAGSMPAPATTSSMRDQLERYRDAVADDAHRPTRWSRRRGGGRGRRARDRRRAAAAPRRAATRATIRGSSCCGANS